MADYGSKKERFKNTIRFLESSDGKNLAHSPVEQGVNEGQVAGGAYGIVPNSLQDFVKQSQNRNISVDPKLIDLAKQPPKQITNTLNENRDLDELAGDMGANLVLQKAGGDEEKAAYGWNTGHNQDFSHLDPENYKNFDYVKKYKEKSKEFPDETPQSRNADFHMFKNVRKYMMGRE